MYLSIPIVICLVNETYVNKDIVLSCIVSYIMYISIAFIVIKVEKQENKNIKLNIQLENAVAVIVQSGHLHLEST